MKSHLYYRNMRARGLLEIFLLSAIGSVLVIRAFLQITGFPQLGGNGLHIAHVLWGGLLMTAGLVLAVAFIGLRTQRLAMFIGGVGFGFFIDEVGKLITSDNDYFFRPAVGIIYASFVILYLAFNFLSRARRLNSREYQLNALIELEEAILHDMDPAEKNRAHQILQQADGRSPITKHLKRLVDDVNLVPVEEPRNISVALRWLDRQYSSFWEKRGSNRLVQAFFVLETILFLLIISVGIFRNIDDVTKLVTTGTATYDFWLFIGQILSSLVAAAFALVGAVLLAHSRLRAFEQFRRATLINLFLTEFFIFSRVEFQALPGFLFNIGVLLFVTYIMHQERRREAAQE